MNSIMIGSKAAKSLVTKKIITAIAAFGVGIYSLCSAEKLKGANNLYDSIVNGEATHVDDKTVRLSVDL